MTVTVSVLLLLFQLFHYTRLPAFLFWSFVLSLEHSCPALEQLPCFVI